VALLVVSLVSCYEERGGDSTWQQYQPLMFQQSEYFASEEESGD
jgi:hypothetical protein